MLKLDFVSQTAVLGVIPLTHKAVITAWCQLQLHNEIIIKTIFNLFSQ